MRVSPSAVNLSRLHVSLVILCPLAFLIGGWLYLRNDPAVRIGLAVDRDQAIEIARREAQNRGIAASTWSALFRIESDNERNDLYRSTGNLDNPTLKRLFPVASMRVLLTAPSGQENFEAYLNTSGELISFKRLRSNTQNVKTIENSKALTIARLAFSARPEAALVEPNSEPVASVGQEDGSTILRYTWKWKIPGFDSQRATTTISIIGEEIAAEQVGLGNRDAYAAPKPPSVSQTQFLFILTNILLGIAITIYGIFRFAARLRQKEVSFVRIGLIALAISLAFGSVILVTDVASYDPVPTLRTGSLTWIGRLFGVITWVLIGLVMGFAYGSGEGDLREAYPGKLTSLDAVMVGKVLSKNVAQAVIFGISLSGWLFLVKQGMIASLSWKPQFGHQILNLDIYLARFAALIALVSWPASSLITALYSLLLPLPFLTRRIKNLKVIIPIIFLVAMIPSSLSPFVSLRPWYLALAVTMASVGMLLVAFFQFDLLTAIVALGVSEFFTLILVFVNQPAASIRESGFLSAAVGLVVVGLAIYSYFRGNTYAEDEVRPLYATNLAERLSLQAEVSAAREAQIRLLPDSLPKVRNLQVAAICQPAREVGGDFYELFELDDGRLGIFMAEGGGRGLAAALTIAFAKGFLMPRIMDQTSGDNSPGEIVRQMKTQLERTMAQDEGLGFVYSVIDTGDQTLRFAGTGDFPTPLINGEAPQASGRTGEKIDNRFKVEGAGEFTVSEGVYYLKPGDLVSFLTDGARRLLTLGPKSGKLTAVLSEQGTELLRSSGVLPASVREAAKHAPDLMDDVTIVAVAFAPETGDRQVQ